MKLLTSRQVYWWVQFRMLLHEIGLRCELRIFASVYFAYLSTRTNLYTWAPPLSTSLKLPNKQPNNIEFTTKYSHMDWLKSLLPFNSTYPVGNSRVNQKRSGDSYFNRFNFLTSTGWCQATQFKTLNKFYQKRRQVFVTIDYYLVLLPFQLLICLVLKYCSSWTNLIKWVETLMKLED